jgi:hypothetical protein
MVEASQSGIHWVLQVRVSPILLPSNCKSLEKDMPSLPCALAWDKAMQQSLNEFNLQGI